MPDQPISLHTRLVGAQLAAVLVSTALAIRVLGVKRAVAAAWWLAARLPRRASLSRGPEEFARIKAGEIAAVAGYLPFAVRCLPRSLMLAMLLRRRSIPAELCLGAKADQMFDAHAWVELDGKPVNEPEGHIADFHCFMRLATTPL